MKIEYRNSPGCGGCILIVLLIVLVFGGFSGLMKFVGTLFYAAIFFSLLAMGSFWFFTRWLQKKVADYERSQSENHNRFVWLLVHILIHIAKIDGQISKEEVQTIHRFFRSQLGYNQTQMGWVKEIIKEAVQAERPLDPLLYEFRDTFPSEHCFILLELVYQLLFTKEDVSEQELSAARHIARVLGISSYEQQALESKYRYHHQQGGFGDFGSRGGGFGSFGGFGGFGGFGRAEGRAGGSRYSNSGRGRNYSSSTHYGGGIDEAAKHYATLGLQKGASAAEIKKAYRSLSMQYHPDKVRNLGAEFQKMAEEKMKEINAAYDHLERHSL